MALDLFQTSNETKFWAVFGGTAAVTYVAAAVGLLGIYRKVTFDSLKPALNFFIKVLRDLRAEWQAKTQYVRAYLKYLVERVW